MVMGLAISASDQTVRQQETDRFIESEAGLIPADWKAAYVEDIATISTGGRNTQDRVKGGVYPFYVRSQNVERINTYSFEKEAVLTAGDGVGTGKIFHYIDGKFDVHQRVYVMSDFAERVSGYFFYLVFSSRFYDRIMQMTAKSSVDSVRREMIARMAIPLPPRREQDAIVEALQQAEGLIVALEQLIEKKRLIKQGVIQELLSGRRRLPGFSGEWATSSLGDACHTIVDGTHYTPEYVENGVPFYSVENITSGDFLNCRYISTEAHRELSRRCKPEKGDILLTRIGSIGNAKLIDWDVDASIYVSLALLKCRDPVSPQYLSEYMGWHKFRRDIEDRSLLNASPKKINMGDIAGVPISLPPRAEQEAIAQILKEMTQQNDALEARLEKARQIKQGMMQELLTGRVRLV